MFTTTQGTLLSFDLEDIKNGVLEIKGSKELHTIGRNVLSNSINRDYRVFEAIKKIVIKDIATINDIAFGKLINVEEIVIDNTNLTKPTQIMYDAFSACPNLKKITLRGKSYELYGCFKSCENLKEVQIEVNQVKPVALPFEGSGNKNTYFNTHNSAVNGDLGCDAGITVLSAGLQR